jgi:hypothetical protein
VPTSRSRESTDLLAQALGSVTRQPWQTVVAQRSGRHSAAAILVFHQGDSKRRPTAVSAGCCLRARIERLDAGRRAAAEQGTYEGNELMPPRYGELVMIATHKESPRGFFTRVDGQLRRPGGVARWLRQAAAVDRARACD